MSEHVFDQAKWQAMSIFAQMGNIGSEVGRAAKAYSTNDVASFEGATKRALDLFDATCAVLVTQKSPRLKEVLLARDQFTSQYFSDIPYVDSGLETYFMQFAIADRMTR
jgi:hypothetical protein